MQERPHVRIFKQGEDTWATPSMVVRKKFSTGKGGTAETWEAIIGKEDAMQIENEVSVVVLSHLALIPHGKISVLGTATKVERTAGSSYCIRQLRRKKS